MLAIGVQTWGTDVRALERYWRAADELGYARITYGDGLGAWTHDGFTMLGALAVTTRRARIGPAVTYGFDASSHHPSWLAKSSRARAHRALRRRLGGVVRVSRRLRRAVGAAVGGPARRGADGGWVPPFDRAGRDPVAERRIT
jgi:hypothetical protein